MVVELWMRESNGREMDVAGGYGKSDI